MYMYIYTLTRGSTDFAMSRYRNKTPQFLNKTTHQVSTDFVCCNIETRYLTLEDNSYTRCSIDFAMLEIHGFCNIGVEKQDNSLLTIILKNIFMQYFFCIPSGCLIKTPEKICMHAGFLCKIVDTLP